MNAVRWWKVALQQWLVHVSSVFIWMVALDVAVPAVLFVPWW